MGPVSLQALHRCHGSTWSRRFATAVQVIRRVAVWGNGDFGRLGHGNTDSCMMPKFCDAMEGLPIRQVACGGAHTAVVAEDGRLFTMGLNDHGQLGIGSEQPFVTSPVQVRDLPPIRSVSAGHYHNICLAVDGDVYAFGRNEHGQLGLGSKGRKHGVSKPAKIRALEGTYVASVSCGSEHTIAVTETGEVLTWGCGDNGRLGHGPVPLYLRLRRNTGESTPRLVRALEPVRIRSVSAGYLHSACVDENGSLFMFGHGRFYQLGLGNEKDTPLPTRVQSTHAIASVVCGGMHSIAITQSGDLYVCGANEHGCLGLGAHHQDSYRGVPVRVEALKHRTITQAACGWKHSAALTEAGRLYTWGWGGSTGAFMEERESSGGQLGHNNEFDYLEPMLVDQGVCKGCGGQIEGERLEVLVRQVSCGFNHTAAVVEERTNSAN